MESLIALYTYWWMVSNILLIFLVIVWIYCILWVAKDISWRTDNFWLQLTSILLLLFLTPLFGLPLYLLLRPLQVETSREDDVEFYAVCFSCNQANDKAFEYCVYCGETLKIACPACKKSVGIEYAYCAWCGHDMKS